MWFRKALRSGETMTILWLAGNIPKQARTSLWQFRAHTGANNFRPILPYTTNYTQWKEGWLKHRTDRILLQTEDDEKAIIAGLEGK